MNLLTRNILNHASLLAMFPFMVFVGTSTPSTPPSTPPMWTPDNLAVAPLAWHDFSLETGSEGDKIASVADQSGNGNTLVDYINSNSRAALRLAYQNGLNVADFDVDTSPSVGKAYKYGSDIFSGKTEGAIFLMMACEADPNASLRGFLWNMGSYSPDTTPDVVAYSGDGNCYTGFGATARWTGFNSATDLSLWNIINAHAANNNGKFFINDIQEATTSSLTVGFANPAVLGAASSNIGAYYSGFFGEIIILDYVPTTSERNKICGYLAWKWGTVARLDSGHPYKSAPPMLENVFVVAPAQDTSSLTTYDFDAVDLGDPDVDRRVIIGLWGGNNTRTISSVTVHIPDDTADPTGITLTSAIQGNAGGSRAAFFIGNVPSGGSGTVKITWSGGQTICGCAVWANYTNGSDTPIDSTSYPVHEASLETVTLDSVDGGQVICIGATYGIVTPDPTWSTITQDFNKSQNPNFAGASGVPSGSSYSFGVSFNNSGNGNYGGVAVSLG